MCHVDKDYTKNKYYNRYTIGCKVKKSNVTWKMSHKHNNITSQKDVKSRRYIEVMLRDEKGQWQTIP